MPSDASSLFNRATEKASQSRYARIESTFPQVPPAHVRRFARQLKIMSDSSIRDEDLAIAVPFASREGSPHDGIKFLVRFVISGRRCPLVYLLCASH